MASVCSLDELGHIFDSTDSLLHIRELSAIGVGLNNSTSLKKLVPASYSPRYGWEAASDDYLLSILSLGKIVSESYIALPFVKTANLLHQNCYENQTK